MSLCFLKKRTKNERESRFLFLPAAATAKTLGSKLVTGADPEFDGINDIQVERVAARKH